MKTTTQFAINDLRFAPQLNRSSPGLVGTLTGSKIPTRSSLGRAFTLIELLVVIAVIATLAALLLPVGGIVVRHATIQRAQSERDQLETSIDRYYRHYGFYPPGNANTTPSNLTPALTNPLYFELSGTVPATNTSGLVGYATLDNGAFVSTNTMVNTYGVSAFVNSTKGTGDDMQPAQPFLPGFLPGEMARVTNGNNETLVYIVTAANSDLTYRPLPGMGSLAGRPANPWRYVFPGINNPGSYDLWVQLYVGGKTNLICNWQKNVVYNSPLP